MLKNFADFYYLIIDALDKGELWGIENIDLTPLELHLILPHPSVK